ncbi:ABC transporter substrate-binding protein [Caenimonas soli]|uniref:ABC transporter substrate-binding protein n=1 Tax=Caenimonas soli TaxID=2735555 RepID=UPI001551BE1F|nr:ABC transporter substrate-binding protein [Caenimonas soli]NPC55908.1 ABC transporter substrate-binding protein [Caenimonas soli]
MTYRLAAFTRFVALVVLAAISLQHAIAGGPPLVIGQSLPLTGSSFTAANRIAAGANAAVAAANAAGGIKGRQIKLVTLDDANDPRRHQENLRRLAGEWKAVALLNCLGDKLCQAAAEAATQLKVPLIGPISGAPSLRSPKLRYVFGIRSGYDREAPALARQIRALGISRAAILSDQAPDAERPSALRVAFQAQGITLLPVTVDTIDTPAVMAALDRVAAAKVQALVVDLSPEALDEMGTLRPAELDKVPSLLAALATPGLTSLNKLFPEKVIGFTSVMPNPEFQSLQLVRNLSRDAESFGANALTFEGLEAYVNTLVCLEAMRRAGSLAGAQDVAEALEVLGAWDIGGIQLVFNREHRSASEWIDIGMRSRQGNFLK